MFEKYKSRHCFNKVSSKNKLKNAKVKRGIHTLRLHPVRRRILRANAVTLPTELAS